MEKPRNNLQIAENREHEPVYTINGQTLKQLFFAALTWLKNHQPYINSLNVFPVPDGDTGTNMFLTMQSAYGEISENQEKNLGRIIHSISQGALMGARGNSGVILSQLLRGFARALDENELMDADMLVNAFSESRNTAYKGVVRPVEGTILTVSKDIAEAAEKARQESEDLVFILEQVLDAADLSVRNTPNLLPILKQAGVVDSGGKGLFIILEGMYRYATEKSLDEEAIEIPQTPVDLSSIKFNEIHDQIEEGQDFEVVVDFTPHSEINLQNFYETLSQVGTSIQVGEGDDLYRMHIHVAAENKYDPVEIVEKFGNVQKIYIENLVEQMDQKKENQDSDYSNSINDGQIAVVVVSPGAGISRIFKSLGVARVVPGGQTMNPSTNDIFQSFKDLSTDKIIILPNNKNIIMAAEATKKLTDKKVTVIPSKNIPQGMVACLRLNPDGDYDEIVKEMHDSLSEVDSGEITTATRSIKINGINVKEGEVITLLNGELIDSSDTLLSACEHLLKKADLDNREHITLFYGKDVTKEITDEIVNFIAEKYPEHELEVHDGGQPHYQLILSIE